MLRAGSARTAGLRCESLPKNRPRPLAHGLAVLEIDGLGTAATVEGEIVLG